MRRSLITLESVALLFLPVLARAHEEVEELGHHWEEPAYLHEIHFQLAAMAAFVCALAAVAWVKRTLRKRSAAK